MANKPDDYKVLINYDRGGVSVARSLYTGPHEKHAHKAYREAVVLAGHGILVDCVITFFDGFRLRSDWTVDVKAEKAAYDRVAWQNVSIAQLRAAAASKNNPK